MKAHPARGVGEVSPEIELLLRTARPGAEPANDDRIGVLLRGGMDWDFVLRQAQAHGTLPLLHWHLQHQGWEAVPATPRDFLGHQFRRNTALNLLRAGVLVRLIGQFRAHGIAVLPFKGPTLAAYAYGNLSLRRFNDLDLLLRPEDMAAGQDVLLAEGYRPHLDLPAARRSDYFRALGQAPFYRQRDASLVELHARVTPRHFHFPLGLNELWGRVESLPLHGEAVPVLAAEDLLLVLAVHGAKHLFVCLGWISDLAALLLSHPALDLARAFARARELRAERLLLLGLCLGYDLLQESPPGVVIRKLHADPVARGLARQVWRGLTGDTSPNGFQGGLFHLRVREHFKDGLAYGLSLALQPIIADWKFLSLPPAVSFLYYGLRPLRLAGKYGLRLLGRRRRTSSGGTPGRGNEHG
jgi:hypothetical protein